MSGSLKKEEVFKLKNSYIRFLSQKKSFKVAKSIYNEWITKEDVFKLKSLYMLCGSLKKTF